MQLNCHFNYLVCKTIHYEKGFLILIAATCLSTSTNAQKAAKSVFVELGGPGLASINYDMRFQKKEDGFGFRVGVGGFSVNDGFDRTSILFVPLGLNWLLGKDGKNYFEVGGGTTLVSVKNSFNDGVFSGTFGHLNFGYRFQPKNGGFTFRAAINPIFGDGTFIPYYAGVSFGYKF